MTKTCPARKVFPSAPLLHSIYLSLSRSHSICLTCCGNLRAWHIGPMKCQRQLQLSPLLGLLYEAPLLRLKVTAKCRSKPQQRRAKAQTEQVQAEKQRHKVNEWSQFFRGLATRGTCWWLKVPNDICMQMMQAILVGTAIARTCNVPHWPRPDELAWC